MALKLLPSSIHCVCPSGVIAQEYNVSLGSDRNDVLKFERLGDRNHRRANAIANNQRDWFDDEAWVLPTTTGSFVTLVACKNLEAWAERLKPVVGAPFPRLAVMSAQLISEARTKPRSTVELAERAAECQGAKTRADISTWIERIVEDVKDADD